MLSQLNILFNTHARDRNLLRFINKCVQWIGMDWNIPAENQRLLLSLLVRIVKADANNIIIMSTSLNYIVKLMDPYELEQLEQMLYQIKETHDQRIGGRLQLLSN